MIATFDELQQADDSDYIEVEAYGTTVRLGSLNSVDMIEWADSDNDDKTEAGLRLIVKSLVDEHGEHVPREMFEPMLEAFRKKNARSNTKVIRAALKLNGFGDDEAKNASGEVPYSGSDTDSPTPQDT